MNAMNDRQTRERILQIENVLGRLEQAGDDGPKADTVELMQALMDLHRDWLSRLLNLLEESGTAGRDILHRLAGDESLAGLLLLYGLHPASLTDRVRLGVDKLQPLIQAQQARLEIVAVNEKSVRLQLSVKSGGCHSTAEQLRQTVEDVMFGMAPDAGDLFIEEVPFEPKPVFVTLQGLGNRKHSAGAKQVAPV